MCAIFAYIGSAWGGQCMHMFPVPWSVWVSFEAKATKTDRSAPVTAPGGEHAPPDGPFALSLSKKRRLASPRGGWCSVIGVAGA